MGSAVRENLEDCKVAVAAALLSIWTRQRTASMSPCGRQIRSSKLLQLRKSFRNKPSFLHLDCESLTLHWTAPELTKTAYHTD
jgi:hypothetical protein